jgi:hypothetical protein
MPHPGCETNKKAHYLDERILEWRVFEAVQPLFASSLQWRLWRRHGGAVDNDAQAIRSENTLNFFKHEMKRLPDTAPEKALSCEVFDNCRDTLYDLLDLLDRLVQGRVLEAAHAGHGLEGSTAVEDDVSFTMGYLEKWYSGRTFPVWL